MHNMMYADYDSLEAGGGVDGFDVCAAAAASSMAFRSLRNSLYSSNGSLKMYTPVGSWVWKNRIMDGEHKEKY